MRQIISIVAALLCAGASGFAGEHVPRTDGEQVYQNNCSRCHRAIHTFPPRMMATVTHHMQVRATLTRTEQQAVLRYLLENTSKPAAGTKGGN